MCAWTSDGFNEMQRKSYPGSEHTTRVSADRGAAHLLQLLNDVGSCGLRTAADCRHSSALQQLAQSMMQAHDIMDKKHTRMGHVTSVATQMAYRHRFAKASHG